MLLTVAETVLPFLIFFTNPIGSAKELGYPIVLYEKHIEQGEKAAREYATLAACTERLNTLQKNAFINLQSREVMPEYRMVMTERVNSMKCLSADAKPEAQLKGVPTKPGHRWRIGKIDEYGYFQGQSLDMRQFDDEASCKKAADSLVEKYTLFYKDRQVEYNKAQSLIAALKQYGCHPVMLKPPPPLPYGWR
jgi:hypothetical protein